MGAPELQLKDIHLPELINGWPPAIGWWLLALFIPLCCGFLIWLYRRITRKTALKSAKKHLASIKQQQFNDKEMLNQLSALLRRVAMSVSPRQDVASLTGDAWLYYLENSLAEKSFSQGIGTIFSEGHYQKNLPDDFKIQPLIRLCEKWLSAQKEPKK